MRKKMLRNTFKTIIPKLKNSNSSHFSTSTIKNRWSAIDWVIGEEKRRERGITPATILTEFENGSPTKLANRLLFVVPNKDEAPIYEAAAINVLKQGGKVTKGFGLWDVAANLNYHTIHGLNVLACRSLLEGRVGFNRAIWGFEQIINDYRKLLDNSTTNNLEIYKKLGAIYNNLAITYLMRALQNSSKINEALFEKDNKQAILFFEEALKYIPNNEVIMLNLEVAKLMNYRVHVSFPEAKLVVQHEEPTAIFSVIKNNLLDNASKTESSTDLAPVMTFGNSVSFGGAVTTSSRTTVYPDNMHIASEMERAKDKVETKVAELSSSQRYVR
jgi:tetratricopeptide (TPR) repeat protein